MRADGCVGGSCTGTLRTAFLSSRAKESPPSFPLRMQGRLGQHNQPAAASGESPCIAEQHIVSQSKSPGPPPVPEAAAAAGAPASTHRWSAESADAATWRPRPRAAISSPINAGRHLPQPLRRHDGQASVQWQLKPRGPAANMLLAICAEGLTTLCSGLVPTGSV